MPGHKRPGVGCGIQNSCARTRDRRTGHPQIPHLRLGADGHPMIWMDAALGDLCPTQDILEGY